jgi:pilus assembly protein CpaF
MVGFLKRGSGEISLDARIAGLSARQAPRAERPVSPPLAVVESALARPADAATTPERLAAARDAILARLSADGLEAGGAAGRHDPLKLVEAAVQDYCRQHQLAPDPLARSDLVAEIQQKLRPRPQPVPTPTAPASDAGAARGTSNRAAVDAAKAHIQPLVLEHMDIAAAAEMPRAAFEAQLSGWVKELLVEAKIQLNFVEQRELVESLIADMLGLGPLEPLLADETVTDIMVNGAKQIYVERRGRLVLTDVQFRDDQHVLNVATKIVTRVGRRVDESQPLVDARLQDGSRVNVIIPPLAIDGPSISIRKFSKKSITLDTMAAQGNISAAMATLLKIAARCRLNILISGGTGSGKTTLLNAMSQLIDTGERVVTIEDAAELQLQQPHVVRLETRPPNLEGTGEITMRDLLRNALRMRPDRIILGEIRGAEALDVLQAMNTGHDGSMSTIHANRPREALTRLENMVGMTGINLPAKAVRTQIAAAVHLIAQVSRMRDGMRRVTSVMEVVGMEGEVITTQELFSFHFIGEGPDGMLRGEFRSGGVRPNFLPRAEYFGLDRALLEII